MTDFTDYLPAAADLTAEQLANARTKMEAIILDQSPTTDTRPGSLIGDNVVSQLALAEASRAVAVERVLSDLDTEAVGRGVIYNCDVAKAFISNFALAASADVKARGLVRLVFARSLFLADTTVISSGYLLVNRGVQFLFNTTDVFKVSLPVDDQAVFRIWKPGYRVQVSGVNQFFAQEAMDGTIYVDVPVMGTMTTPIIDGATGQVDVTITSLASVTSRSDFLTGFPAADIPALARRSRKVAYAASLSCKAGAAGFVYSEFPSAQVVSPVTNGDAALTRGTDQSLFLLQKPCLDLYVRSGVILSDTLVLRLPIFSSGDLRMAAGPMTFNHVPIRITEVSLPDSPDIVITQNSNEDPAAGIAYYRAVASCIGSLPGEMSRTDEELYVMTIAINVDDAAVVTKTDAEDDYILLAITYEYDPLLAQVASVVQAARNAPAGVSVKCRGFMPMMISSLSANYFRIAGTTVNIGQAREEVLDHVNGLGWPDLFTRSGISDSLLYAGARGLRDLTVTATVLSSVTELYFAAGGVMPTLANYADTIEFLDNDTTAVVPLATTIESSLNMDSVDADGADSDAYDDWVVATDAVGIGHGSRVIRWILDTDDLSFTEVVS